MRRLINSCWSVFRWGCLLVLAAVLAAGGYLYFRLDDEIRRYAHATLARRYPALSVSVGGARFVPGRGVTLFDVSVSEPPHKQHATDAEPLVYIPEVMLAGAFEMRQWVEGEQVIERVVVRRPRLVASRRVDGGWRVRQLWSPAGAGQRFVPVEVLDASLVVRDETRPAGQPLVVRNINLTVEPVAGSAPDPPGPLGNGALRVTGGVAASLAKQLEFDGRVRPTTGDYQMAVDFVDLRIGEALLAAAPGVPQPLLADLRVRGMASGRFEVSGTRDGAPRLALSAGLTGGSVMHPTLPRPLTELSFTLQADAQRLAIRDLTCKCGVAEVSGAGDRYGWGPRATARLRGRVTGLPLDEPLRGALPERLQKHWRRFQPAGVIDLSGWLAFDGSRWRTDTTIDCRGVSATDVERFPYRFTEGRGTLRYFDARQHATAAAAATAAASSNGQPGGTLTMDLRGLAEGRPVTIAASLTGLPGPESRGVAAGPAPTPPPAFPVGWMEVRAPRLRVSPALIAALAPHPQAAHVVRQLNPSGEFSASWRIHRPAREAQALMMQMDLRALDMGIAYKRFPYPISGVRGELSLRRGVWSVRDFEAKQAGGPRVLRGEGTLRNVGGRGLLQMKVRGEAVALDETLRNAMRPAQQALWAELQPAGRIDFTADVTYRHGDPEPRVVLDARPNDRSVSVEPTFFPYRLDRLDGRLIAREGRVEMIGIRAEHGRTQLEGGGVWSPMPGGGWRLELGGLQVDHLDADHDLRLAAPLPLRRVIDGLRPEGGFGLHDGRLVFNYDPRRSPSLRSRWDLWLDCHQASADVGVRVDGVTGSARLIGASDGRTAKTIGQLDLDTLFWNGLQLTRVRGPLYSDAAEVRIGRGAADAARRWLGGEPAAGQASIAPVEVTADAYGGGVSLDSRVVHGELPEYAMAIGVRGVDLNRLSRDYLQLPTPLAGRLDGRVALDGRGVSAAGLKGSGALEVSNANLYELPAAVALLKVLRNRVPDTTAFDSCRAEFSLAGEDLSFSRLDLLGDAVSLHGRGVAGLDRQVDLTFHTVVGRGGRRARVLRSLMGQASEQILRLRVLGPADSPQIVREPLPMVGNVLEQLRTDLQPRPRRGPADVPRAAALKRAGR